MKFVKVASIVVLVLVASVGCSGTESAVTTTSTTTSVSYDDACKAYFTFNGMEDNGDGTATVYVVDRNGYSHELLDPDISKWSSIYGGNVNIGMEYVFEYAAGNILLWIFPADHPIRIPCPDLAQVPVPS